MVTVEQGDILKISGISFPVIVVSNNLFNSSGMAILCPIAEKAAPGPLHIPLKNTEIDGIVICEQVKFVDLTAKHFSKCCSVPYFEIMDISDAVQGMFEY